MFEQLKNLKNLGSMLGQAQQLREKFEQLQAELSRRTVEAEAGAGAVRVVMNGKFQVQHVHLDRPLLTALAGEGADADAAMVEDLLAAAFNAALQKAQEMVRQEMTRLTGGLNLPGMDQMLGDS